MGKNYDWNILFLGFDLYHKKYMILNILEYSNFVKYKNDSDDPIKYIIIISHKYNTNYI